MEQKVLFKVHMPKSVDKPLLEILIILFVPLQASFNVNHNTQRS